MISFIWRVFFAILVVGSTVYITNIHYSNSLDTSKYDLGIMLNKLYYSDLINALDFSGVVNVGVIDSTKFDQKRFEQAFVLDDAAIKVSLQTTSGVIDVYTNKILFDTYYPLRFSKKYIYEKRTFPVTIQTADGSITTGNLYITAVMRR